MNTFDKELTRIIVDVYNMGRNDRDSKQIPTTISSITQALDESKQAVDKYVIEEMRTGLRTLIYDVIREEERAATTENLIKIPVDSRINRIFEFARQSLWGDKQ